MTDRRKLGDFGERLARTRLEADGCRILATNVRMKAGEIDIVATDGEDTVFVEVRTRRARPGLAAESLDDRKLVRMWECAMQYCDANGVSLECIRIDAISVDLDRGGKVVEMTHFKALEIPEMEE